MVVSLLLVLLELLLLLLLLVGLIVELLLPPLLPPLDDEEEPPPPPPPLWGTSLRDPSSFSSSNIVATVLSVNSVWESISRTPWEPPIRRFGFVLVAAAAVDDEEACDKFAANSNAVNPILSIAFIVPSNS